MKYHLITFGCQMNKSDSERIKYLLEGLEFEETKEYKEADFIIINSCSVRQSAEDRIFGLIKNFNKLKKEKRDLVVAITGCMPGRDGSGKIRKRVKGVDLFFPISELHTLYNQLKKIRPEWVVQIKSYEEYLKINPHYSSKFQAFIPIQIGCNRFCSYCIVPYSRGREQCRKVVDIIKEIEALAQKGYLHIELLGQVINNYQAPDPESFNKNNPYKNHFAALLWEANQVKGIERIHFTSAHPIFMDDEVIDALTLPKQINYLHLAVQSGDNKILKAMNRPYTTREYLQILQKIREKKPEIALGTDIIVGFPGEGEKEFQKTISLYKKADFDIAYLAKYSPRSGTLSAKIFEDNISWDEKKRRWRTLQNLMEKIAFKKNQKYLDKKVEVLVEKYEQNKCSGWSREMKMVEFVGNESLVGKLINVKIKETSTWVLRGEPCANSFIKKSSYK